MSTAMRRTLPSRLLAMVSLTALLAVASLAAVLATVPLHLGVRPGLEALGLGLTILLARRFPVHLTEKTKTTLSTVPLFAAVLLLSPPLALLTVAAGMAGAELWRRTPWFQALFNSGVGVLQTVLGSLVIGLLAGPAAAALDSPARWFVTALLAAVAIYAVGIVFVETIVSLQLGRLMFRRFWQRIWLSLPQEGMLHLLGLLLALLVVKAPWAVLLLPAPLWLVHRSLVTMARGLPPLPAPTPVHLAQLSRSLQLYIVAVVGVSILALATALALASSLTRVHPLVLAGLVCGLTTLCYRMPVKPAPKRVLLLNGAVIMAGVLTLPIALAVLAAALGTAIGNACQRRPWFNLLFNAAQEALAVLAAALLYHALASREFSVAGQQLAGVVAATCAAATYWSVSCVLVDGVIALQLRRSPFAYWLPTHRHSLMANAVLLPLGLAIAPAVGPAPWLLGVLLLPALVVRVLLHTALQLDAQTALLVDDLLASFALEYPALPAEAERRARLAEALAVAYGLSALECQRVGLAARLAVTAATLLPEEAAAAEGDSDRAALRRSLRTVLAAPAVAETLAYRDALYDGSGDPAGPRGAGIPLAARILAIIEGWVALAEPGPGRPALPRSEALPRLLAGAGKVWDPELVGLLAQVVRSQGLTAQPIAA